MGIKPIEYVKDSSTAGFAVAGDEKTITKTNANTIQKDVAQGNTEKPDIAQQKFLEGNVDYDNLDYTEEEMKNTGKNQIDAEGAEKTSAGEKAASVAGTAAVAGGFLFAQQLVVMIDNFIKIPVAIGHLIAAGIMLAAAAAVLPIANAFDPQYGERISKRNEAEQTNQTIQQYYDDLGIDMDSMAEESGRYQELVSAQTQADVDTVTQIGALQSEMMVYQSQGNTQKVAELKAQIEDIKKGAEEDGGNKEEITNIKGNLEAYAGRSAEARGVKESGDQVSDFLLQGTNMGIYGSINTLMLGLASIKATLIAVNAIKSIKWPWDAPIAFAASAIDITVAALFLAASYKMGDKTKNEFECADAGDTMAGNLGQLGENIEAQSGYTETTAAGYLELDTKAAETVGKTQQGVDKANQAQAQRQQGTPSTPPTPPTNPNPTVGDGTGEGEPEGEDELVA